MNDMIKRAILYNKKGFSLIETIVAFAIIAIILVVALIGFNTISRVSNTAMDWNKADQTVETLIANNVDGVDSDEPVNITLVPGDGEADVEIKGVLRTFTDPDSGKTITIFVPD